MKSRPILFSAPMVRALLAGTKTQTRRVCKPANESNLTFVTRCGGFWGDEDGDVLFTCPYGQPGLRLWVRESHSIHHTHGQHRADGLRWGPWGGLPTTVSPDGTQIAYYREGFDRCDPGRWRPSIHMPRWASRLTIEITGVRVERLQDISEADAWAEGVAHYSSGMTGTPSAGDADAGRVLYRRLWESINGPGSWNANPWVWVLSFKRAEGNGESGDAS